MTTTKPVKLWKPRTPKGKRALEKRAPKLVEDPKKALFLFGNKTSQLVKDVLADLHKLKAADETVKYTRKNDSVRPFEAAGDASLEFFSNKTDCSLFAMGNHSKKRPHNVVLGRLYDHRFFDCMELGVEQYKSITSFGAAADAQVGNKPCFVFAGDGFESDPRLQQVRSLLLDFFRGRQVEVINLKGLDRVMFVTCGGDQVLLRQYRIRLKKSGTRVPRVHLTEMGPRLNLVLRRHREAPVDVAKEATQKPKPLQKKKEKNVGSDLLDGKVGRIYMPKQDIGQLALRKMKGLKRERREAAAAGEGERKAKKLHKAKAAAPEES